MDAKTSSLILTGSRVGQILADRVQIDGSLMVNQGFEAAGLVSIAAASVRGTLECSGATFMNAGFDQYSLMAAGIRIGAEAFLNGAAARGCLSFYRADIRGDLDLRRARIGDGAKALVGDYLTAGGVSMSDGFQAAGEVRLAGARLAGNLVCSSGRFRVPKGEAISADGLTVTGGVFLSDGFSADGTVRLARARIGAGISVGPATFRLLPTASLTDIDERDCLLLEGSRVDGNVFLRQVITDGLIRVNGARIGGRLNITGSVFDGAGINGLMAERTIAEGGLQWQDIRLTSETQLDLGFSEVGILVDDEGSWPANGNLYIDGFTYTGLPIQSRADQGCAGSSAKVRRPSSRSPTSN